MKNRHMLNKKEARKIINEIEEELGCKIDEAIEIGEYENMKFLFINRKLYGMIINEQPFLNVLGLKKYKARKKFVVVDDGAIKYILNGANIMAAGVTNADEDIKTNEIVWVKDSRGLPLAVGKALMDGKEMKEAKKGKAVENIHHIGDRIWKMAKESEET